MPPASETKLYLLCGKNHPFHMSETDYDLFSSYFEAPQPREGFNTVIHRL